MAQFVGPELVNKVIIGETNRYKHYKWYIKYSSDWQIKRQQRMKIDNYKCVECGVTENLEVHHLSYENLFHEEMIELETVCRKCHEERHKPLLGVNTHEKL